MPAKVVLFIPKLPHLSMADFKTYYETKHKPLIKSLETSMADQTCLPTKFTRKYLVKDISRPSASASAEEQPPPFGYDVITEISFQDIGQLMRYKESMYGNEDIRKALTEDEVNFIAVENMKIFVVDECE